MIYTNLQMTEREIFYRHLGLPSFYPMDIEIERAEGVCFYGKNGEQYFDLVAGITVSNTGHRHPKVLEAIHKQLEKYLHLNVYGEFIQSPQVRLAEKLAGLLPTGLDVVYFVNSGSEAIEGAMKLAKRFTGRTEILSFRNAYHGSTQGSLSILGDETLKRAYRPLLPGIRHLEFNNPDDLKYINGNTACVVMEMIQAEAGIIPVNPGYLEKFRSACNEAGALIVVDDVQMGMGRTGKMFSLEHYDFVPDIVVLAKALGAGMPLGAFIAPKRIMDTLAFSPELGHITTFGGHPVSCAAGLAGIEVLIAENLLDGVDEKGRLFEERLSAHRAISAIRRVGLALGVDLADPEKKGRFMKSAIDHGVIIDWYLFRPATFRIAPPLTITEAEIHQACDKLISALEEIS